MYQIKNGSIKIGSWIISCWRCSKWIDWVGETFDWRRESLSTCFEKDIWEGVEGAIRTHSKVRGVRKRISKKRKRKKIKIIRRRKTEN